MSFQLEMVYCWKNGKNTGLMVHTGMNTGGTGTQRKQGAGMLERPKDDLV